MGKKRLKVLQTKSGQESKWRKFRVNRKKVEWKVVSETGWENRERKFKDKVERESWEGEMMWEER